MGDVPGMSWERVICGAIQGERLIYQTPADSMHRDWIVVTASGAITISVNDEPIMLPLREWHRLANMTINSTNDSE
jgi:hypothetical protein